MKHTITVILNDTEMDALQQDAQHNLRRPRDHMRHILRMVLLGEQKPAANKNTDAVAAKQTSVGAVS